MAWGEIVRWNEKRGFGFVRSDYPVCQDVFVHLIVLGRAGIEPIIGTNLESETEIHNGNPRIKSCTPLKTWRDAATAGDKQHHH
jgi:cold shock CspA family protein